MNDFYPIYKMKLKPWIKYWFLKKTSTDKDNLFINFPNQTITLRQELTNGIVTIKQTFNYTRELTITNNVITGYPTIGNGTYYIWNAYFSNLKPSTQYTISGKFVFNNLSGNVSYNYILNNKFFTVENESSFEGNSSFTFTTNVSGEYNMVQFINIGLADFNDNSTIKIYDIQLKEVK